MNLIAIEVSVLVRPAFLVLFHRYNRLQKFNCSMSMSITIVSGSGKSDKALYEILVSTFFVISPTITVILGSSCKVGARFGSGKLMS